MLGKTRLLLIKVDGDEIKMNRRTALQRQQNVEQGVGVLAPRETHITLSPSAIMA